MPERSTEELLRALPRDLEPVRPVAPLRVAGAVLAGAFALALGTSAALGLPLPGLARGVPWDHTAFVALLLGLLVLALGGLVAGLAATRPGRAALERWGQRLAWAGLAVCALAAFAWALAPPVSAEVPLAATLMCLARAAGLSALPALVAGLYAVRAHPRTSLGGGVWLCLGAVALGAAAVHASCAAGGAAHVLLGHLLEPLAVAALVGLLVSLGLRRVAARAGAA